MYQAMCLHDQEVVCDYVAEEQKSWEFAKL